MILTYEEIITPRHVTVLGLYNMRDLGGLPRTDGQQTKQRVVYRADNLARLQLDGVTRIENLGIRTVIDLRATSEVETTPNPFHSHTSIRYHHIDLIGHLLNEPWAGHSEWYQSKNPDGSQMWPVYATARNYWKWLVECQAQFRAIMAPLRLISATLVSPQQL